ncbi:MAG TPA: Ku protein [Haloplasmataceae bacterium]
MAVSWKGSISFGLIYIPIQLIMATREQQIPFNQLHKKCQERIQYKKICSYCGEEVKSDEIIKGYEYEKGEYVIFTDEDFERLKSEKDKTIQIEQFVQLEEIDPVYYEKAYYVEPTGGEKAFFLLLKAMEETNKVGLAKVVFGKKEHLVALRIDKGTMYLYKLYFHNEIIPYKGYDFRFTLEGPEVELAKQLIQNLTRPFDPERFYDSYYERLKDAIEHKIQGKSVPQVKDEPDTQIMNLMEALRQSIRSSEGPRA